MMNEKYALSDTDFEEYKGDLDNLMKNKEET